MLFVRNDFIENDALNFVFSMIDEYKSLRVDYALSTISGSTGLCYDAVLYVIDLYNQRNQSHVEYLTGKMLYYAMRSDREIACFYENELRKLKS